MKSILSAVVGATLALAVIEADADGTPGERQVALVIESKTLAEALDQWAQQSGFQIVVQNWDLARKLAAPTIRGRFSATAALDQLLKGTPFAYSWLNDRAVAIRAPDATVTPALQESSAAGDALHSSFRLAHLEAADSPPRSARIADSDAADSSSQRSKTGVPSYARGLEEILVTGTHIRNINNDTVPVTVLDKQYIDATGISTTTGLIESLPQNFALTNPAGVLVPGVSGPRDQGASINLRAIGEGTTLVLLNGRRLAPGFFGAAVDISAIPLSALERVEVLTDGASALYGSDAIGGVVNFVLRRDLEGAETRLRAGWADGVNELRASQAIGHSWESGGGMVSGEYYKRDLLSAADRDFVPAAVQIGSLYPEDENYSAMLSVQQSLGEQVSAFADALYTKRNSYNEGGFIALNERYRSENPQLTATMGLDWLVGADWQVELAGTYGQNKLTQRQDSDQLQALGFGTFAVDSKFKVEAAQLKSDGPLLSLPGGDVHMAMGAEWRAESLDVFNRNIGNGRVSSDLNPKQTVRSAFAELYVPIVGVGNARAGTPKLALSLAGRYDDYDSFGSSFDPQFGLTWAPFTGLRLRGSYGTSYKAPKLTDYDLGLNASVALFFPDPGSATGISQQLWLLGNNPVGYRAQESTSASFGVEFSPASIQGLDLTLNYFRIHYQDQIASLPNALVVLGNPNSFSDVIFRNPSVDQVIQYLAMGQVGAGFQVIPPGRPFTPGSVNVILDLRRRNLSAVKTNGLDGSLQYEFDALGGKLSLGVFGTYLFRRDQQVTASSSVLETVDTFSNPPDLRVRTSVAWRNAAWTVNVFGNYSDSYTDKRIVSAPTDVSSYTTVDLRIAYDVGRSFSGQLGNGLTLALSAQNALDEDPPATAILSTLTDMGFDPTNANPMGRLIALEIIKSW